MKLADLFALMLQAHGRSLQRLAALYGEDILIQLLEHAGEAAEDTPPWEPSGWLPAVSSGGSFSGAYHRLETAVRELRLSPQLEFHVWAFPIYRSLIESAVDLDFQLSPFESERVVRWIDEMIEQANQWLLTLKIPDQFLNQTQSAASLPWIQFRTEALKSLGRRPMEPL